MFSNLNTIELYKIAIDFGQDVPDHAEIYDNEYETLFYLLDIIGVEYDEKYYEELNEDTGEMEVVEDIFIASLTNEDIKTFIQNEKQSEVGNVSKLKEEVEKCEYEIAYGFGGGCFWGYIDNALEIEHYGLYYPNEFLQGLLKYLEAIKRYNHYFTNIKKEEGI